MQSSLPLRSKNRKCISTKQTNPNNVEKIAKSTGESRSRATSRDSPNFPRMIAESPPPGEGSTDQNTCKFRESDLAVSRSELHDERDGTMNTEKETTSI
jgi:hypothetical protein